MIKLEDLKIGDKVYGITSDGLGSYQVSIVQTELLMLDIFPEPAEAVICKGGLEIVPRHYENYIFRTWQEADEGLNTIRINLAKELLQTNKFMDRLFECATTSNRLSIYEERPIYEMAIKLYNERNK